MADDPGCGGGVGGVFVLWYLSSLPPVPLPNREKETGRSSLAHPDAL
ncbi:MAG: hypothetical protein MJE68_04015 [Proteobacteria bacterium]|nr:hypothetical protein [Pseudomonadota bacterium]